jgi:hypothetical protein
VFLIILIDCPIEEKESLISHAMEGNDRNTVILINFSIMVRPKLKKEDGLSTPPINPLNVMQLLLGQTHRSYNKFRHAFVKQPNLSNQLKRLP